MAADIKEASGFRLSWKLIFGIISIMIIILFFAYFFGIVKKTCADESCFNDALQKCSMAKYLSLQNYNYYRYTIEGSKGGYCEVRIELVKMALGTPQDKLALFEGKGMTCRVPKAEITKMQGGNVEGILKYCSGPLKEAMYQTIIEKLYTLIISNMGEILGEMEDVLGGKMAA